MLMTFDAPDSNVTCTRRERSNTPLQALTLWNDPVFFECAQSLGKRLAVEKGAGPEDRIKHAFELCLSREPTQAELKRLARLYHDELRLVQAGPENAAKITGEKSGQPNDAVEKATLVALSRVIMNLDEFVTRE
jgi:uncharacterized protein YciI